MISAKTVSRGTAARAEMRRGRTTRVLALVTLVLCEGVDDFVEPLDGPSLVQGSNGHRLGPGRLQAPSLDLR